ncbi:MAG: GH92 family glycosyl hydrolase [Paludibacteraceae bacterium]
MKKLLLSALLSVFALTLFSQTETNGDLTQFVNPLMGTMSKFELSNGNTYPAIGMPWAMNLWTPQTGKMGDGWTYQYTADKIIAFKQTHQPSPWMNDYAAFSIMPTSGEIKTSENDRASWFAHKGEVVNPHYYKVYLADYDLTTELAPTDRAAIFRITYPGGKDANVIVDAYKNGSYIKILPSGNKIIGYTTFNSGSVSGNFKQYFVIQFDRKFDSAKTWNDGGLKNDLELKDSHAGGVVTFKNLKRGEQIIVRVASSYISFEQAELNLKREIGTKDFETVKKAGQERWNEILGKIRISGGTDDQIRTFYSSFYRTVFFPLRMDELDATGKRIHYSPYNGKVEAGYKFGGTGFWDTFRALYPFLNLVYPSIAREMMEGLINDYKEGGWLPEWSSPGYRNIMIGQNSASVVAEAYMKGLRGYDINTLYEALVKGANAVGPIDAVGRAGYNYYNQYGYIPSDVNIGHHVARTLEYAYDDYAIYALGKALGKSSKETDLYFNRAMNYKNVFDKKNKLMAPRKKDGKFEADFNPYSWDNAFIEGNSWHYSWSVFQDMEGLKKLMGGDKNFIAMLDTVFVLPPDFGRSSYGGIIHEMREMQVMNMGQYAHGNQPIQHMAYLYDYAGEPWKSQYHIREIMNRLYNSGADGYCGDEDNGQTSAWYVFSALGFYPVTPAYPQYALGTPLFKKMIITFENGKKLNINAPESSEANKYIQKMTFNDNVSTANYLNHFDLIKGGTINFEMGNIPNKNRGIHESDFPFSLSK